MVRVTRRPAETIVSFREPDLVGCAATVILGIPCMAGIFIWAHPIGWWVTGAVVVALTTLHTRIRIDGLVWTERRVLGVAFQRRVWSRSLGMTWWHDWDLMCPSVLTIEDGAEPCFELYVSPERADMIRDEVQRAIRRHAKSGGYRG